MKKLLYVCEADSGGIMEYAIRQSAAITHEGVEVHFLCKPSFPTERLATGIVVDKFAESRVSSVQRRGLAGKISTIWRLTLGQRRSAMQVAELATKLSQTSSTHHPVTTTRHRPRAAEVAILFACYKEYFAPFWVGPLRRLARQGVVMGTIAHDPVRDFVVGPLWWHRWSVRLGYSFVGDVFVHDDTPVDFGGKRPEGIEVHQIPHGPYEVAEPKIGRLEMRRRFGFLTTDDSDRHGCGTTKDTNTHERGEEVSTTDCTDEHGYFQNAQGHAQGTCAGATFSNPSTSELARDVENASLTRSASGPSGARITPGGSEIAEGNRLADSMEILEGQSQAGLQMDSQNHQSICVANNPGASGENSSFDLRPPLGASPCGPTSGCSSSCVPARSVVPIREIRGSNSEALDPSSPATSQSPLATPASPDVVFLAFGQIRDGKNLDLFLRAMTRLPENVKLLVAGKGDSGSSKPPEFYQKLAEELGVAERCRWDIRRIPDEEVGDIFAACDVVLVTYSSKFRSASGVLNAAVSARKPVLASSGAGPLKTVVEKYQLGLFVEPDHLEEIFTGAKKLMDLISASFPFALAPGAFVLDTRSSTLDPALSLAPSTLLNPDWKSYGRDNSWEANARGVLKYLFS